MHPKRANEIRRATASSQKKKTSAQAPAPPPPETSSAEYVTAGQVHHTAGRLKEAEALYRKSLEVDANNADGLNLLGVTLFQSGDLVESESLIRKAMAIKEHAFFHSNLGNILLKRGDTGGALAAYRRAIELKPDYVDAHINLAVVLTTLNDFGSAANSYVEGAKYKPGDIPLRLRVIEALSKAKRFTEAVEQATIASNLNPTSADLKRSQALALLAAKSFEDAKAACLEAIRLAPRNAVTYSNLGNIYRELGDYKKAAESHRTAIRIDPRCAMAHSNLGVVCYETGEFDRAERAFKDAIAINPNFQEARYGYASLLLRQARFEEGWAQYESRPIALRRNAEKDVPRWLGEEASGKTILLQTEQGLGDILQCVRFVPVVAARGLRVLLEGPKNLKALLSGVEGLEAYVISGEARPPHQLRCSLFSLPWVLDMVRSDLAYPPPYLRADPDRVLAWKAKLPTKGFKVGIAWQGNPDSLADRGRSPPVKAFAPLAEIPGVALVSLQKHHGLDQLRDHSFSGKILQLDDSYDSGDDSFLDAAAVIANLDLIITPDTALAHLTGALNAPNWIALKQVPDWRWHDSGDQSDWYPNTRLFRQSVAGDWTSVFEEIAANLMKVVTAESASLRV